MRRFLDKINTPVKFSFFFWKRKLVGKNLIFVFHFSSATVIEGGCFSDAY